MKQVLTKQKIKNLSSNYFLQCENDNQFPTISGLAYALGFSSKDELLAFDGDDKCLLEVKRALLYIEKNLELALFNKDFYQPAKFILNTQFSGWSDKEEKSQVPIYIVDDVNS